LTWVKQQALTNISEDEFSRKLDSLEAKKVVTRTEAMKFFMTFGIERNSKRPNRPPTAFIVYDEKWVESHVKSKKSP